MATKIFKNPIGDLSLYGSSSILLDTNKYLSSSDFPNTTTLYGWRAGSSGFTTIYGGKDLTESGALTSQTDHLGNTVDCGFDGSTSYLSSTDSAFNFTGTFSIGFWAYRSSWAAISTSEVLISRHNGINGWTLFLDQATDIISFKIGGSYTVQASVDFTGLTSGWHHIVMVRSNGSYTAIYIDGLELSKTLTTTAITAAGNLEIGSGEGGSNKFTGRITDLWIHNGTAWTSEQVKKIYARGSRQFATIKSDGNVDIQLPLEGKWFNWLPVQLSGDTPTFTITPIVAPRFAKYTSIKDSIHLKMSIEGSVSGTADNNICFYLPVLSSNINMYNIGNLFNNSQMNTALVHVQSSNLLVFYLLTGANFTNGTTHLHCNIEYPTE